MCRVSLFAILLLLLLAEFSRVEEKGVVDIRDGCVGLWWRLSVVRGRERSSKGRKLVCRYAVKMLK